MFAGFRYTLLLGAAAAVAAPAAMAQGAAPEPGFAAIRFSPDGKGLIFQTVPHAIGDVGKMFRVNLDGSGEQEIPSVASTGPQGGSLSPDGSRIAYLSLTREPPTGLKVQLASVGLDGSNPRILHDAGGFYHEWSPDGKRILFATLKAPPPDGPFGVGIVNADGSGFIELSTGLASIQSGAWSPDGKRIIFAVPNEGGSTLVIASPDGTNWKPLVSGPRHQSAPIWSRDGQLVAFFGGDSAGLRRFGLGQHLYVVKADGTSLRQILVDARGVSTVSFSPDSKKILFADRRPGRASDIYVIDVDGKNERALVSTPGTDELPSWSPDGSLIAYQSSTDPQGRNPHVYVMNADGTGSRRIR